MIIVGSHDRLLVILSVFVAAFASFTALSLASRIRASTGWNRRVWLATASVALGGGIWSMHFVAMLAFSMPGMTMTYEPGLTLLSLGLAVGFTGAGFALMSRGSNSPARIVGAGVLMGTGVAAMHYVGMAAMRMEATLSYERVWLSISVLIAIGAATAAVWLTSLDHKLTHRIAAAAAMGAAIAGMHYAGMKAAVFAAKSHVDMAHGMASVTQTYLATSVGLITILILILALGAARLERSFEAYARREARIGLRLEVADVLRERDTRDALEEVASLMGKFFGVSRAGYGQLDPSENAFDFDVCWTDDSVPPMLGCFALTDFDTEAMTSLNAGTTVAVADLLRSDAGQYPKIRRIARDLDARSILVVPFVRDGRLRTIVHLSDRHPRNWHPEDVRFLEEIAERTRLVIERAAVEDQLRELNATLEARVEARTEELRRTEEARRQADTLYRAYFENTPDPLFVIGVETDGGFVVEQVNPAHEAGVGFKLEEIRGKRIEDVLPQPAAEKVLETYRHVVKSGEIYRYSEVYDVSGGPQHWDTTLVPLRDDTERIVRLIGSSRNVTRQVMAEEALRQSQKMEAMGQLTGGVAHDFNNLLTPIVGLLDRLMRKGTSDEREQRLIAGAAQAADRARTLVHRLLSFARRQPLQPAPVDVGRLAAEMAGLISSTTGPCVEVRIEAQENSPLAVADANQLEMALLNLCVNARDAMPDGGTLRISVSAEQVSDDSGAELAPGRYLCLSVADTGVGMDEETLKHAIEPFFSTKGVGRGTGLGLSMAHGLAAQLGGALRIKSKPGHGTTVELWLPQSTSAAQNLEPANNGDLGPITRAEALLVDDEEVVRTSTAHMLEELGYTVREAASADEALRLLESGLHVHLLVTDHLMPGLSGTELARKVRASNPGMQVLIISGYAEAEGIDPSLPRLAKPFLQAELAAKLAEVAESSASAGEQIQ